MFKKKRAVKHRFKITFLSASGLPEGSAVRLSWKRGAKSQNHGETALQTVENGQVLWNESVSILCTMFGTSSGSFEEKDLSLTLLESPVGGKKGKETALGKVIVNLSELISVAPGAVQTKYHTVKAAAKKGAAAGPFSLEVSYQSELVSEGEASAMSETDIGDELSTADGADDATSDAHNDPFAELVEDEDEDEAAEGAAAATATAAVAVAAAAATTEAPASAAAAAESTPKVPEAKSPEPKSPSRHSKSKKSKHHSRDKSSDSSAASTSASASTSSISAPPAPQSSDDGASSSSSAAAAAAAAAATAAAAEAAAAAAAAENAALKGKLEDMTKERDELKQTVDVMRKKQGKKADEVEQLRKQNKECESALSDTKRQLSESQRRVVQLENDALAAGAATAAAAKAGDDAAAALAKLQGEMARVEGERDAAQRDAADLRDKCDRQKKDQRRQKKDAQDALDAAHRERDAAQARVRELEAAAGSDDAAKAAIASLQAELAGVRAERDAAQSELVSARAERDAAQSDLAHAQAAAKDAARRAEEDAQRAGAKATAAEARAVASERAAAAAREERAALEAANRELTQQLARAGAATADSAAAAAATAAAATAAAAAKAELARANETLKDVECRHRDELAELRAQIEDLEDELAQAQKQAQAASHDTQHATAAAVAVAGQTDTIAGMLAAASAEAKDSEQARAAAEAATLREELAVLGEVLDGGALKRFAESGRPYLAERVLARLAARGAPADTHDGARHAPVTDALALAVHTSFDGAATPLYWVATLEAVLEGLGDANPCELAPPAAARDLLACLKGLLYDAYVAAARVCCTALERVVVPSLLEANNSSSSSNNSNSSNSSSSSNISNSPNGGTHGTHGQQKTAAIVGVLADALKTCKAARLPQTLRRSFLAQLVHAVDALVVDALLARQEFCTCATGFALRMGLSSLEAWLQRDPDTVPARRRLCHVREAANFFVMDKALFADDAAVAAAFAALNVAQLARLLEYFHPDELARTTVDAALIRDMNAKAHAAPECALQIDPLALV